jgi:hypothetical protein
MMAARFEAGRDRDADTVEPFDHRLQTPFGDEAKVQRARRVALACLPIGIAGPAKIEFVRTEFQRDPFSRCCRAGVGYALETESALVPRRSRLNVSAIDNDVVYAVDHFLFSAAGE